MDVSRLIRDAAKVHACLKELPDGRLVALKEVKIMIPSRFAERGLASIGIETHIVGIYAMIVEDQHYCVSLVNARLQIEPTAATKVMVADEEYYEFYFAPGSTIVTSLMLVKQDTLTYRIYDEIFAKARVPWYIGYLELGMLFDTAEKHAGTSIGKNREVTELLASIIARNPEDRRQYYRQVVKDTSDLKTKPPAFVPMRSVTYAATNTTNKLAGSYFSEGVTSALVSPSDRVERIEELLRK